MTHSAACLFVCARQSTSRQRQLHGSMAAPPSRRTTLLTLFVALAASFATTTTAGAGSSANTVSGTTAAPPPCPPGFEVDDGTGDGSGLGVTGGYDADPSDVANDLAYGKLPTALGCAEVTVTSTVPEAHRLTASCVVGTITEVTLAVYGRPKGRCGAYHADDASQCLPLDFRTHAAAVCLGQRSCTISVAEILLRVPASGGHCHFSPAQMPQAVMEFRCESGKPAGAAHGGGGGGGRKHRHSGGGVAARELAGGEGAKQRAWFDAVVDTADEKAHAAEARGYDAHAAVLSRPGLTDGDTACAFARDVDLAYLRCGGVGGMLVATGGGESPLDYGEPFARRSGQQGDDGDDDGGGGKPPPDAAVAAALDNARFDPLLFAALDASGGEIADEVAGIGAAGADPRDKEADDGLRIGHIATARYGGWDAAAHCGHDAATWDNAAEWPPLPCVGPSLAAYVASLCVGKKACAIPVPPQATGAPADKAMLRSLKRVCPHSDRRGLFVLARCVPKGKLSAPTPPPAEHPAVTDDPVDDPAETK